jgi:NADH:ubiquinone oxidoreductase subunit C
MGEQTDAGAREAFHEPTADGVAAAVAARVEGAVALRSCGQPVLCCDRRHLAEVARLLRDEQAFTSCVDVTAVDHLLDADRWVPPGIVPERFEVVANFLSHPRNLRLRVIVEVPEDDPVVPSLTGVFPGTAFAEREVFDLFGIRFEGHPDLTRILMPDDWDGHPLRKDAPPARIPVTFKAVGGPR